jgi:hypothetical protein
MISQATVSRQDVSDNEIVVHHGISRFGLWQLHVLSRGAIDREKCIAWVEAQAAGRGHQVDWEQAAICAYEEEDIRMHHLRVYWKETDGGNGYEADRNLQRTGNGLTDETDKTDGMDGGNDER